jgi:hypothetical protein
VIRAFVYRYAGKLSVKIISMSFGMALSKTALKTYVESYLALNGGSKYGCLLFNCSEMMCN